MVLHQHDHGHGHGHGHSHGHGHGHGTGGSEGGNRLKGKHHHNEEGEKEEDSDTATDISGRRKKKKGGGKNINVRAAFIHVIGDLIQSIGVVIAGYIIKFFVSASTLILLLTCFSVQPQWHIVDPICTFLFSILVIISTLNVLRDAMLVLMEGKYTHMHMYIP